MTIDEAITMLNAKAECITKVCKGIYEECNEEMCDNCDLCYAQGNNGEQKELCLSCVEWLEELKLLREELKSHILYDKELAETKMFKLGYNKAIDDIAVTLMDIISSGYDYPNKQFEEAIWGIVNDALVDTIRLIKEKKNEYMEKDK